MPKVSHDKETRGSLPQRNLLSARDGVPLKAAQANKGAVSMMVSMILRPSVFAGVGLSFAMMLADGSRRRDGPIVASISNQILTPTSFSVLK